MSTTKAALRNLNEGLVKLEARAAAGERHLATLVGDIEKLRESNHNIANGVTRVEGKLLELADNDKADVQAIGELQSVVGSLSDRVAELHGSVGEMLQRFDRVLAATSIKPEPPSSVNFAAPEETTNPGLHHGDR